VRFLVREDADLAREPLERRFVVPFRAVLFRLALFRVVLFRVPDFLPAVLRAEADLRVDDFFRRDCPDSDIAIATAWRRLFTLRPEPLRSLPSLYSCMTFPTLRRCCFLAIGASGWKLRANPETRETAGCSARDPAATR
jgi:hypothetical protein